MDECPRKPGGCSSPHAPKQHTTARSFFLPFIALGIALTSVIAIFTAHTRLGGIAPPTHAHRWSPSASWAQYSPYFPVGRYGPPPRGCKVVQIQRHGARFPTSGATVRIRRALDKFKSALEYADPRLHFLANYTYDLGTADLLPFGAAQSFEAGKQQFERYAHLVDDSNLPFVRASGSERVVLSATNWTAGFAFASHQKYIPKLSVILSESANDTLDDKMCPNAGNSDAQTALWRSVYAAPISARLNAAAPGSNITDEDIFELMSLCPFESVYKASTSPFCHMFSAREFQGFAYHADLGKFYGTGDGAVLGRVQGVGYVNELLARLTGQPVRDHTQTNTTLDASPTTFPLNRTIYADFSHDNQMIAIYAALGLFPQPAPLDPVRLDPERSFVMSRLVPFAGRMVVEKVGCVGGEVREGEYVRVFVNDGRVEMGFCGAGGEGMCEVGAFVGSQGYARSDGGGDFERCFE